MSQIEQRDFRIANNMIYHLIFSQAGTVAKALTELVMNSQDAGANEFNLTIDNNRFKAEDNGRGFKSRDEIQNWFEELGFAHTSDLHQEEGRFSRFGLGRAQIMAFAPTNWRTNQFRMDVDIKNSGMGYELHVNQPVVVGCSVDGQWYEPMSFTDLKTVTSEFEALIAYARIDVKVNGLLISKRNIKWDYETDQVFIKRRETGNLEVYNQGVLVRSYSGYHYGSGIVVSKVPFTLNIARNDILQSSCEVWKEVRKFLQAEATDRTKEKKRLSDDERQFLLNQLLDGTVTLVALANAPLIEDVTGRKHTFSSILRRSQVTVHTSGTKLMADRIHQSKMAFVMSSNMLEAFNVDTAQDLIALMDKILSNNDYRATLRYTPIQDMLGAQNEEYVLLKNKELTKTEKVVLGSLSAGMNTLANAIYQETNTAWKDRRYRQVFIGESDCAEAWTDGRTFIAIERSIIKQYARDGFRGFTQLANLLVHELCHDANSATSHGHDAEFYQIFHDVLCNSQSTCYGSAVRLMTADFLQRAQKAGLKLSKNELRDMDREVATERKVYEKDEFLTLLNESVAA